MSILKNVIFFYQPLKLILYVSNNKQVRNEAADDYLCLLKEWEMLVRELEEFDSNMGVVDASNDDESSDDDDCPIPSEVFEVERLLDVVYGDPNNVKKPGLYFQVFHI